MSPELHATKTLVHVQVFNDPFSIIFLLINISVWKYLVQISCVHYLTDPEKEPKDDFLNYLFIIDG